MEFGYWRCDIPHKDPNKFLEYHRQYRLKHRDRISKLCRDYRAKHRDELNKNSRLYHAEHREELNKYCKEYYQKHKETLLKNQKEYYWRNKETIIPKVRKYQNNLRKSSQWIFVYKAILQRCTNSKNPSYKWYGNKGIKCNITAKEVKILWFRDNASLLKDPTIDRIDSKKHYEFANCRFIERAENTARANKAKYGYNVNYLVTVDK